VCLNKYLTIVCVQNKVEFGKQLYLGRVFHISK